MNTRTFLVFSFCGLSALVASGADYDEFRRGVQESLRRGQLSVEAPHVDWRGKRPTVMLPPQKWFEDVEDVRMEALRAQLCVESIRKHRTGTARQRKFWNPVLQRVESQIRVLVENSDRDPPDGESLRQQMQAIDEVYEEELTRLARSEGREGVAMVGEAAAVALDVRISPGGEVRYMSAGRYTMHQLFEKRVPDWESTGWTDVVSGDSVLVAQICHFAYRFDGEAPRFMKLALPSNVENVLVFSNNGVTWQNP